MAAALGLVAVGRLYKHVEPRHQFKQLTLPGHQGLVQFAVQDLLRAAARARSGPLADAACKLLVGSSSDRLCDHEVTAFFDVRKCRGLDDGWAAPPEDADMYGIGWALLANPGETTGALSGLRVLVMLTAAERWLVAQVALALAGRAVCGAGDGSHVGQPAASPLRDGLTRCLSDPQTGELQGVLAAVAVVGMLQRCEHPGVLLRSGLGAALVKGWRDSTRPLTSALCAYALADLSQESRQAHSAPWRWVKTEEEIDREVPRGFEDDPEKLEIYRAQQKVQRKSGLLMKEEYEAGVAMFCAELEAAGVTGSDAIHPARVLIGSLVLTSAGGTRTPSLTRWGQTDASSG